MLFSEFIPVLKEILERNILKENNISENTHDGL